MIVWLKASYCLKNLWASMHRVILLKHNRKISENSSSNWLNYVVRLDKNICSCAGHKIFPGVNVLQCFLFMFHTARELLNDIKWIMSLRQNNIYYHKSNSEDSYVMRHEPGEDNVKSFSLWCPSFALCSEYCHLKCRFRDVLKDGPSVVRTQWY